MQLTQLRSFVTIAREQNLTRAAEILHLSQSAISSQLKGLEERLGVSLFERTPRGMLLSDAGKILLKQAEEVLDSYATLEQRAETLRRGITASVTIGLNTDPTFLRVSAINQRLSLLHPDLNIIFQASETATTAQRLKNGLMDLGFFYGDLADSEIAQCHICHVRTCVAIPSGLLEETEQTPAWDELTNLPWVWVDDKFPLYRALSEKLGQINKLPHNIVTAANEQIVRELVSDGQGIALMREDEARPLAEAGRVVLWEHGWSSIPLKLGWLRENENLRFIRNSRAAICYIWAPQMVEQEDNFNSTDWI